MRVRRADLCIRLALAVVAVFLGLARGKARDAELGARFQRDWPQFLEYHRTDPSGAKGIWPEFAAMFDVKNAGSEPRKLFLSDGVVYPGDPLTPPDGTWQNSLGMKFVPVPGTDVLFSIWETRRQDYAKFRAAQPDAKDNWHKSNPDPTHPVLFITWKNATAFCEWLTQHERALGTIGPTQRYRLPRDAEWSAAVGLPIERGATPYSRKTNHESDKAYKEHHPNATETLNGNYADRTAFEKYKYSDGWTYLHKVHKKFEYRDGFAGTAPVGSFQPNKLGIYDLGGNAEEWCEEAFAGPGPTKRQHFVRGASYREAFLPNTFSTHRFAVRSDLEGDYKQGFRIVLTK